MAEENKAVDTSVQEEAVQPKKSDKVQKNDILHNVGLKAFVYHGVSAVLHNNDLSVVFLNMGQSLRKDLCPLVIGYHFACLHGFLRCGNRRLCERNHR